MKDFFDIWLLSRQFEFNGLTLSDAIQKTVAKSGESSGSTALGTPLPT